MSDFSDLPGTSKEEAVPSLDGTLAPRSNIGFWRSRSSQLRQFVLEHLWAVSSLVALICLLYWPTLRYEFLNWDDLSYIVENDLIKSWHPLNLWRVMTEPVTRNFAPLTIATFLIEHTLWGLNSGGYHATNVLLHALNAVLVFAFVKQWTRNSWAAWIGAALFAVHPMQIESVAWVSSRKTLLSSASMLACGMCYLRPQRTVRNEAWGLLWLLLGLLCKASTVVVPPIVVAYDMLVARKKFSEAVPSQVIPCFLCVMLTLITMSAQNTVMGGVRTHMEMNKLEIVAIDATLMVRYLSMLAVPEKLCVLYDPPTRGIAVQIALSLLAWGGLTGFLWVRRDQYPRLAFGLATWYWLLFPVLNFFPITTLMNDRYMYLPCIVVFMAVVETVRLLGVWVCARWGDRESTRSLFVSLNTVLFVSLIGAYAIASHRYLPVWRNPMTLWGHARQVTPTLAVVHIQWATTLQAHGDIPGALSALQFALDQCHPDPGDVKLIQEMQAEWSEVHTTAETLSFPGRS